MQEIEPYFHWREHYTVETDARSPFFGKEYNEFAYSHSIYNYVIHPQWDAFGSATLYHKILFVDYDSGFAVIELIGEWNDCLYNDIMFLKREIIDHLIREGVRHFVLVGENVLNFHGGDNDYYEEWFEELEDGWIIGINFQRHVEQEMVSQSIDQFILLGAPLHDMAWRKFKPKDLFTILAQLVQRRLTPSVTT